MYRCLCGAVFERPRILRETDHYGDGVRRHMRYLLCPFCGLGEQYFGEITNADGDSPESAARGSGIRASVRHGKAF